MSRNTLISNDYISFFGKHTNNFVLPLLNSIIIDIFFLSGEPILPHLGCYRGFAVKYYSFTRCAYYLPVKLDS